MKKKMFSQQLECHCFHDIKLGQWNGLGKDFIPMCEGALEVDISTNKHVKWDE